MTGEEIERRIGRFDVADRYLIDSYERHRDWIHQLFSMVIIVRCEHHLPTRAFAYTALSEHFDPIEVGAVVPFYEAMITRVYRGVNAHYALSFKKRSDGGRGVAHLYMDDVTSGVPQIVDEQKEVVRKIRAKKGA